MRARSVQEEALFREKTHTGGLPYDGQTRYRRSVAALHSLILFWGSRFQARILFPQGGIRMDGIRILIVDDETEAGEILSLRLRRRGLLPICASSGEAALAQLEQSPADIVLLDMKMPGMDGLATLKHIRESYPALPVIILSGHADLDSVAKGMELGAFFYLMKPVNLEDICHKIEDARRQSALDGVCGHAT